MCCLFLPQFFSGGWTSQSANSLRIVGDLMLVQPDGSLISAKGLEYSGPDLNYQTSGIVLLSAIYEPFSLEGEILDNPIIIPNGPYPNHCRTIFPSTTHRLEVWGESGQISTSSYYSILHENDFIIIIFFLNICHMKMISENGKYPTTTKIRLLYSVAWLSPQQ